ncbi:MAG TPA: ABC transporter permease [Cellulomonas sp.]
MTTLTARTLPRPAVLGRLRRVDWILVTSSAVLLIAVVAAVAPGLLTSVDPLLADPLATLQSPSAEHLAGTDLQGRDVFSRIVHGARYSLAIGAGATLLGLLLGLLVGAAAAVGPGWLDRLLSRTVDVIAAFPEVLLALVLITFTSRGVPNLILALGIAGIPRYSRLIRTQILQTQTTGYVGQAHTFGLGRVRTLTRHVLPNALGALPVVATIGLGGAIIGSSALSFLGLGPQQPSPEWGLMLSDSRDYLRHAWWTGVLPGLALTAVVIAATALGRRLQARYERRTR